MSAIQQSSSSSSLSFCDAALADLQQSFHLQPEETKVSSVKPIEVSSSSLVLAKDALHKAHCEAFRIIPHPLFKRPCSALKECQAFVVLEKDSSVISTWLVGGVESVKCLDRIDVAARFGIHPLNICFIQNQLECRNVAEKATLFIGDSQGSAWLLTPFIPHGLTISPIEASLLQNLNSSVKVNTDEDIATVTSYFERDENLLNIKVSGPFGSSGSDYSINSFDLAVFCCPLTLVSLVNGRKLSTFVSLSSVDEEETWDNLDKEESSTDEINNIVSKNLTFFNVRFAHVLFG